jgi:hypothetical protein
MKQIKAVFEVDGSDVSTLVYPARTEANDYLARTYLVDKAKALADKYEVELPFVTVRFLEEV